MHFVFSVVVQSKSPIAGILQIRSTHETRSGAFSALRRELSSIYTASEDVQNIIESMTASGPLLSPTSSLPFDGCVYSIIPSRMFDD